VNQDDVCDEVIGARGERERQEQERTEGFQTERLCGECPICTTNMFVGTSLGGFKARFAGFAQVKSAWVKVLARASRESILAARRSVSVAFLSGSARCDRSEAR
jgi:hypothetical protein